jgi:hypothetical protein
LVVALPEPPAHADRSALLPCAIRSHNLRAADRANGAIVLDFWWAGAVLSVPIHPLHLHAADDGESTRCLIVEARQGKAHTERSVFPATQNMHA